MVNMLSIVRSEAVTSSGQHCLAGALIIAITTAYRKRDGRHSRRQFSL